MRLVSLDLRIGPALQPRSRPVRVSFAFTSREVTRRWIPGRGLLYSLLVHEIAIFGLILPPVYRSFTEPPPRPQEFRTINLTEISKVIYLPALGGGSEGGGHPGARPRRRPATGRKGPSSAPAHSTPGLSYPGPQPIISDLPKPTNYFQTILQPGLVNPPVLKPPLALPNIVQMADAGPVPVRYGAGPVPHLELPPKPPPAPPAEPPPPAPAPVKPAVKAPEPVVPIVKPITPEPLEPPKLALPTRVPQAPFLLEAKAKPPEPKPVIPIVHLAPEEPIEAPKLELPTAAPQGLPALPEAKPPEPVAKPAEKPVEKHVGAQGLAPLLLTEGRDAHNLLALSPTPAPPEASVKVPVGEARGRFAISPEPNLTGSSKAAPGANVEGPAVSAIGTGAHSEAPSGNAAGEHAGGGAGLAGASSGEGGAGAGKENGVGSTGAGMGKGSGSGAGLAGASSGEGGAGTGKGNGLGGTGAGTGKGSGSGGNGAGAGQGSGVGPGTGRGPGNGTGSGAGAGPGNGAGGFPGISIQGGSLVTGIAGKPSARSTTPAPRPTSSYALTIVSTARSGGGLADFGVFRNEQVYTVYLDIRPSADDPAPSWVLQYAPLRGTAAQASAPQNPARNQEGLIPPFAVEKELPHFPAELARKYLHRQLVVYAIINTEGKLEQISVKQSPDLQLNQPLLDALSKWVFRPAELNGEPVPAKVLLGIPVSLPI